MEVREEGKWRKDGSDRGGEGKGKREVREEWKGKERWKGERSGRERSQRRRKGRMGLREEER